MIKVGDGNTAEVFLYDETKVLKLFKSGMDEPLAIEEYKRARRIADYAFPKARVYDLIHVNDRLGLVYERIEGISLQEWALATKDMNACAEYLSKLHNMMFQCEIKNNEWPDYKENLYYFADRLAVSTKEKEDIKRKITSLPSGRLLCHGDFHPGNIIINEGKAAIIDYANICCGPREYDIARTVYLIRYTPVPKDCENPEEIRYLKEALARLYLKKLGVTKEQIMPFLDMISIIRKAECPEEL